MERSGRAMATVARVFNVVGFAGSLRRGSYNRALLRAATELAPPALHIVIHELDEIPLYNGDVEAAGAPPSVVQLRDAIRKADGLLIATPEYNHGVPGVLKNTIDWLSRPPRDSASERQSRGADGSLARHDGNRARPIAIATGICIHQHVRAPAAGGPRRPRARKVRRRRSPRARGDAGFPRDLSPALYRSDRASRYGCGKNQTT